MDATKIVGLLMQNVPGTEPCCSISPSTAAAIWIRK